MNFNGIDTPAVTPLDAEGQIDDHTFTQVLEHLIAAKVDGIVIGGSTVEYYGQTTEERLALAALAREVIGARALLIVGTGAVRTADSVVYAAHARKTGADAILVGSPPYASPTQAENAAHALAVDRAADLPVIRYNYPGRIVRRTRRVRSVLRFVGDALRAPLERPEAAP